MRLLESTAASLLVLGSFALLLSSLPPSRLSFFPPLPAVLPHHPFPPSLSDQGSIVNSAMSSTDPSEKNKDEWSPLPVLAKGGIPPPHMAYCEETIHYPSLVGGVAVINRDHPLPAQPQPQPYSMFVDRNQPLPLETYPYAPQANMYTGRNEPLQHIQAASGSTDAQPPALTYPRTFPPVPPTGGYGGYPSTYPPTTQSSSMMNVDRDRPLELNKVVEMPQESMHIDRDRPLDFTSATVEDLAISSSADGHQMRPNRDLPLQTDADIRIMETKEAGTQAENAIMDTPDEEHPDMDPEMATAVAAFRTMQAMQDQSHNPFNYQTMMTVHRDHVLPLPSKSKERSEDQEVPLLVPVSSPVTPAKPTSTFVLTPPQSSTSSRLSNVGEDKKASASLHVDRNMPLAPVRPENSAMNVDRDTPLLLPSQPIMTPPQSYTGSMMVDRDTPLPSRPPRPSQSQEGAMRVDRDTPLPRPILKPHQSYPREMHVERITLKLGNASAMHVDQNTPLPVTDTPANSTSRPYGFPSTIFGAGGDKSEVNTTITPTDDQDIPLEERGSSGSSGGVGAAPAGYNPMMYPAHLMNTLQQHRPYMGTITYPQPVFGDNNKPLVEPDPSNAAQPMMPTPLVLPTPQKNALGAPEQIDEKTATGKELPPSATATKTCPRMSREMYYLKDRLTLTHSSNISITVVYRWRLMQPTQSS